MPQLQLDAEGREVHAEINVQLEAPSRVTGAQILDVNAHNKIMRETAEKIHDPDRLIRVGVQHEADLVTFQNLDLVIGNLEYAGRDVPARMIEDRANLRIQLEMSYAELKGADAADGADDE